MDSKRDDQNFCVIFIQCIYCHLTLFIILLQQLDLKAIFFFIFCFTDFFAQQVSVGGRNKNKNKIHSDHFPIELKSKETHCVSFDFNSIGKWSE